MEEAARRFARRVLTIHILLLVGVVALVFFAAREVYRSARAEAIEQAAKRQSLLADQTARGIESYYSSIIDNLELLRRSEEDNLLPGPTTATSQPAELGQLLQQRREQGAGPARNMPPGSAVRVRGGPAARFMFAPTLWHQLRSRASMFMIVNRDSLRPTHTFPITGSEQHLAEQVVETSSNWLRQVDDTAISKLIEVNGQHANLICVPVVADSRFLFVAVVPLHRIEQQFLESINAERQMSAMLLDEQALVVAGFDPSLIGKSMMADASDRHIREIGQKYVRLGRGGTEIVAAPFTVGSHQFYGGMVSIQPINMPGGKRWWLSIGSTFDEVDSVVRTTFREAVWWAIFVVVSVSAILVSTASQMIRSRVRLERTRHEILRRELQQARQIQIAWLPKNDQDPEHIDLEAVNRPASHISGDFYNWFDLPDGRVCVVIGDVTGHGMSAAFLMATTQLLVRMVMPRVMDPGRCMEEVNRQLCQQVFAGQFVTMQILVLDRANARVEIATAGHPPPLLGRGDRFEPIELETQLVLGVERDVDYPTETCELPDGASIVLYTDGVIEAQAPDGRRFEIAGLRKCVYGRFENATAIAECVLHAVDTFRAGRELGDDLTLVTIQLEPVIQAARSLAQVS